MNIKEAIQSRRSIGKVKQDPVEQHVIEEILEAAVWAPNHYQTEPWKFWVMTGNGRSLLGQAYADVAEAEAGEVDSEQLASFRVSHEKKAFRAPVVIAVGVSPSSRNGVIAIEEYAAVHAAVQNMLLIAHSLGLGAIWRTGAPTYHTKMREAFKLESHEELAGFIYIGYPEMEPPAARRTPFTQKTTWVRD
jgi:nitroreductase